MQDSLFALLGVIIGGLITYFVSKALDDRKWKQQKQDMLAEEKREAILFMLDKIIIPKEKVLFDIKAKSHRYSDDLITPSPESGQVIHKVVKDVEFPSAKTAIHIPNDYISKLQEIFHSYDEIMNNYKNAIKQSGTMELSRINALSKTIKDFKREVGEHYKNTYK